MTTYEELRQKHLGDGMALLPGMLERIGWSADRLAAHRRQELRRLVRVAKDLSPWHRKRLSGVHPDEVDESTLRELPVMTKDDLMANFDEIVTDDRLRLDVVEDHLGSLTTDAYLFDRYHACASGGSSGRRGVFVYDWDGWAVMYARLMRYEIRARTMDAELAAAPPRAAVVMADQATHATSALTQTFSTGLIEWHRFPVTLPIDDVVAGLNAVQPSELTAYASVLCPLVHVYGTSEAGGSAVSCGDGPWLHLSDDLVITERSTTPGGATSSSTRSTRPPPAPTWRSAASALWTSNTSWPRSPAGLPGWAWRTPK